MPRAKYPAEAVAARSAAHTHTSGVRFFGEFLFFMMWRNCSKHEERYICFPVSLIKPNARHLFCPRHIALPHCPHSALAVETLAWSAGGCEHVMCGNTTTKLRKQEGEGAQRNATSLCPASRRPQVTGQIEGAPPPRSLGFVTANVVNESLITISKIEDVI